MNAFRRTAASFFVAFSILPCNAPVATADEPATLSERTAAYRRHGLDASSSLESRVKETPRSVLDMFKELGGPAPTTHGLTNEERRQLKAAIEALPPLHRRVLTEHLRVISFLDGMPNTALTSTVNADERYRLFDITINASILRQNVSEWLTQKERTCFDPAGSPLSVSVDAGNRLDALVYAFLHEATHVIDASERITPVIPRRGEAPGPADRPVSAFTAGVWSELNVPVARFRDPIRERINFYADGGPILIGEAPAVYAWLRRTPFVSLYGSRNWLDDLAEYVTVYHLTEVMKQPYRIVIRNGVDETLVYEPMKSDLVRGRIREMKRYYSGDAYR
jgi:hypothetical protein